jgi:integron integrase
LQLLLNNEGGLSMKDFQRFLSAGHHVSSKKVPFYLNWVRQCLAYCQKNPKESLRNDEVQGFISNLSKCKEKWQIAQAKEAVELYRFYKNRPSKKMNPTPSIKLKWETVLNDMVNIVRLRHLALATERSYISWVRSFRHYLGSVLPSSLNESHLKSFLTYLAVERRVAASTQNQAFNALLFLYRNVLDKDLKDISDGIRAKRKRYLPVVLSRQEIGKLISHLTGLNRLTGRVIYGCGLRLRECIQLRIKDIDFDRNCVVIRGGKGDKDRQTVLAECLKEDLKSQLKMIRPLFLKDRKNDVPGVELPYALERKLPNAGKEWAWQWVFPSQKLSVDPRSKTIRRHHIHPSNLQKHIRKAAQKAAINKRVTVHTLRHSFATHLLEDGCDIRTIQVLLGHSNIRTTMIYTHVAEKNIIGVYSPLDKIQN